MKGTNDYNLTNPPQKKTTQKKTKQDKNKKYKYTFLNKILNK